MKIIPDVIQKQDVFAVQPGSLARTAAKRMAALDLSTVLVIDSEGRLIGIVTEKDFTRHFVAGDRDLSTTCIGDIMTEAPDTVAPDDPVREALTLMELQGYRHLPVVDAAHRPIAVVTVRDLYATVNRMTQLVLERTQTYVFGDRYHIE